MSYCLEQKEVYYLRHRITYQAMSFPVLDLALHRAIFVATPFTFTSRWCFTKGAMIIVNRVSVRKRKRCLITNLVEFFKLIGKHTLIFHLL